jgi:hypothetical protein
MFPADFRHHRSHAALRAYRILQDYAYFGLRAVPSLLGALLEGAQGFIG